MPRGGRRQGAGRKTAWESGCTFAETTVIRIPKVLKNKILEVAHKLDAGEEFELVTNSKQLELSLEIENKEESKLAKLAKDLLYQESLIRPRDRSSAKKLLSALFKIDKAYFDRKK